MTHSHIITTTIHHLSLLIHSALLSERWSCWGATCTSTFGRRLSVKVVFIWSGVCPPCQVVYLKINPSVFCFLYFYILQLWKWSEKSRVRHTRWSPAAPDEKVVHTQVPKVHTQEVCFVLLTVHVQSALFTAIYLYTYIFFSCFSRIDTRCRRPL